MTSEWTEQELGDLLEAVIDHRGRTPKKLGGNFTTHGIPVISARNVKDSRLVLEDAVRYISPAMWDRWMPVKLSAGDVLLTSEAPLGETAYVADSGDLCLGQRLFALRADSRRLHSRYLFYALQGPTLRSRILARASGTTAQGIRQAELVRVPVPVPPVNEQRRIARILSSLDDKIENNRWLAKTLEAIIATLFKARFVDFVDHDHLVESEVGPIPQRWAVGTLGEIAVDRRDSIDPQTKAACEYEHFSFPAFDAGRKPEIVRGTELKSAKLRVTSDHVLLSKLNPKWQRVWWPRPSARGVPVCSPEFVVLQPSPGVPHALLYATARFNPGLRSHILSHATGTTGSRQRVRPSEILRAKIAIPPKDDIEELSHPLATLFAREEAALEESRALAAIRDTLLPRLISGQIRVPAIGSEGPQT